LRNGPTSCTIGSFLVAVLIVNNNTCKDSSLKE
jgi:hypothetical protein